MTLREQILLLIRSKDYKGLSKEELAEFYELDRGDYEMFFKTLYDMEKEGLLYLSKKGKFLGLDEITSDGVLEGSSGGFAFFIPDNADEEDVFIPPNSMAGAIHGDRVRIKITKEAQGDNKAEGQVIKLLSTVDVEVVGTFVQEGKYYFVEPNNKKYNNDIFIPQKFTAHAKHNDKVVVRLIRRAEKNKNPEGRVIEILGNRFQSGVEVTSIAREFELPYEWPAEVEEEVKNISDNVEEKELEDRTDFTDIFTVTIDGENAKDFDDAISISKLEDENYKLIVHIADVTNYVKEGSPLDKEAYRRGNSVYLLDRVIPMLPEKLSNGLCSLKPGETRLTHSVEMIIDGKGEVLDYHFYNSFIKSDRRLVYDKVSDFLEKEISMDDEFLEEQLILMENLRKILHEKRVRRGALDFNIPESEFELDDKGRIKSIFPRERRIADAIIEEFMIVCNETVSEHFGYMEYPFLYRVHEEPALDKVEAFKNLTAPLGYTIKGKDIHAKDFQALLNEVKDKPEERLISTLLLRTMKKARYSADRQKHFGLASSFYSHFTAPIRRYADLVIHRVFNAAVENKLPIDNFQENYNHLTEVALHVSETERQAEEAERAVEDYMKTEYMKELKGRNFKGIISSLTSYGIYVELENTVEGLASFRNQRDDYYSYDSENHIVFGEKTGKVVKIGMEVKVTVLGVDEIRNEIDFEIIEWW